MTRLTLGGSRATIARVLGKASTSADVPYYLNEAQERLLNRATDPYGSYMRFRVCVGSSNCLTLPRQVRTVKSYWVCNTPGRFKSEWHEAVGWDEGGYGLQGGTGCGDGRVMLDQGTDVVFDQPTSTTAAPCKIQVVASDASDNGKKIVIRYVDGNGNRVYTSIAGTVQEGEEITLSTGGTLSASVVATGGIYHVIKPVTNFPVRLYAFDTIAVVQTGLLACYEPSETLPVYRKVLVPGLRDSNSTGCCGDTVPEGCTTSKAMTILARLQHVPVVVDNDPLVIGNLSALKLMVKGIKLEEQHETTMAEYYFNSANRELDGEIAAYLGDGMTIGIKVPDVGVWGPSVFNPVGGGWNNGW